MKIFQKSLLLFVLFFSPFFITAQQNTETINALSQAIKNGNSSKLATYFNTTIDLELGDADGNYSKKQAEMIIRDFFTKHPVKSFTIKHQGSSTDGSKYIIGSYISSNNTDYRVYILLKESDTGLVINQVQFEED